MARRDLSPLKPPPEMIPPEGTARSLARISPRHRNSPTRADVSPLLNLSASLSESFQLSEASRVSSKILSTSSCLSSSAIVSSSQWPVSALQETSFSEQSSEMQLSQRYSSRGLGSNPSPRAPTPRKLSSLETARAALKAARREANQLSEKSEASPEHTDMLPLSGSLKQPEMCQLMDLAGSLSDSSHIIAKAPSARQEPEAPNELAHLREQVIARSGRSLSPLPGLGMRRSSLGSLSKIDSLGDNGTARKEVATTPKGKSSAVSPRSRSELPATHINGLSRSSMEVSAQKAPISARFHGWTTVPSP